jgi:enamine deaminase RidA (YjgF/YER057c/UK114 family)
MFSGTIEEETKWCIEALRRTLKEAGADLDDVVKATVEARAVVATRIEIDAIAYKPE